MSAPVKPLGIVVAVDGSPASNAATCWAARDAALRNVSSNDLQITVVLPAIHDGGGGSGGDIRPPPP
jgi:hypothetical protein